MLQQLSSKTRFALKRCVVPQAISNNEFVSLKCLQIKLFSTCSCRSQQNHYGTLGLKQNATASQIKSRFYDLSRTHHPDMNAAGSSDQFKQISEAYTVLSNHNLRKQYDQSISSLHSSASDTYASMSADGPHRNAVRRKNANYAWTNQRSSMNFRRDPRARQDPLSAKRPNEQFFANLNRFEQLARRKKLPHSKTPHFSESSTSTSGIPKVSAAKQTIQLAFMLSFICWIGSKLPI